MDKKYLLTGGKTTVDLKKTQEELLKIKSKLDRVNIKDKKQFAELFNDIFKNLKPVVDFITKLKNVKDRDTTNYFLQNSDVITKLLHVYDFDEIQFNYNKLSKVIPPIRINKLALDKIDFNENLVEETNKNIGENKKTLTINLNPISFSIKGDTSERTPPKIDFNSSFISPNIDDLSKPNKSSYNLEFKHNDLKLPDISKFKLQDLTETSILKPTGSTSDHFGIDKKSITVDVEKDFDSEYKKLLKFIDDKEPTTRTEIDTTPIETTIKTLQEKIEEITGFTEILIEPLDLDKIKLAVDSLVIRKKTPLDLSIQSNLNNGFYPIKPTSFTITDTDPVFLSDKVMIKQSEVELDNDPFKLSGGNFEKYLESVRDSLKPTKDLELKKSLKQKKEEFVETVNKFNLHYVQYNYFKLYIVQKILKSSSESYYVYPQLSLNILQILYEDIKKKFLIINNPKINIFNDSVEISERNTRKKLFFKQYYIIYILYYFHKFLVEKAIEYLHGERIEAENYDFSSDKFTSDDIINLLNEDNSNELKKIIVLFNFFMFTQGD